MAHGRPWYQRNGGDFLMATISFPDVETRWVYSAIVDMLNDRDRPIADDAKFICGFTGLTLKKWSIARKYLLAGGYLVLDQDGCLTNPRFERERAARAAKSRVNSANGRDGGLKSAALRQQGELGLEPGKHAESTPESRGESTPESTPESGVNGSAIIGTGSPENNHLAQATAQASRARERTSEARGESLEKDSTTANPSNRANGSVVVDEAKTFDMLATMNRLAQLGGVAIIKPSAIANNMDTVKRWIEAGYDIENTVVPTITQRFNDTQEESIGGLNFYSAAIAKAHAQASRRKPVASDIAKPILMIPDEDPRMAPIRQDLFKALGDWAFSTFLNHIRLEPVEMGPDDKRHPLRLKGDPARTKPLLEGERRRIVTQTIRQHGFTEAWSS